MNAGSRKLAKDLVPGDRLGYRYDDSGLDHPTVSYVEIRIEHSAGHVIMRPDQEVSLAPPTLVERLDAFIHELRKRPTIGDELRAIVEVEVADELREILDTSR